MTSNELSAKMSKSIINNEILSYNKKGKMSICCKNRNKFLTYFFTGVIICTIISVLFLDINWIKLISRVPSIGDVLLKLMHLNIDKIDLIGEAFAETVSIAVLSTIYSMILGIIFGMIAAENIFRIHILSVVIKSFFTFLRAVPTPVWVLLMLVCMGFGPSAGIAGLCVHTTAFFTKSFSQSFEDIPNETIEALEVTGANKISVFTNAVIPAALSQLVAWIGVRFEINFSECAVLGMVGAGGIGFVISSNIQAYDYSTAGVAILCVFLFTFVIERLFIKIKYIIK